MRGSTAARRGSCGRGGGVLIALDALVYKQPEMESLDMRA